MASPFPPPSDLPEGGCVALPCSHLAWCPEPSPVPDWGGRAWEAGTASYLPRVPGFSVTLWGLCIPGIVEKHCASVPICRALAAQSQN